VSHGTVAVVGGGIGGVATVAALRAGGYAGELLLLDRAEFPYDRPPLSKEYLAGTRHRQQIALQRPEWYVEQRVQLIGGAEVTAVVPAADEVSVELADGRVLVADHVVLATGGRAARPPIPGSDSAKVFVIRDAEDADALRAVLTSVHGRSSRLLVVGGGLIGAETASTAHALGAEVVLVDPLDPPLAAAVGPEVARYLHHQHTAHGIETLVTGLESVQETATGVAVQLRDEPAAREFDAIVLGVGMVPNTELAEAAGLEVDRGVLVDETQATSHPRVFAIGDCARLTGHRRAEHWEAAQHDGQRVAATIMGTPPPATTASWWWSDRHDRHVEGAGTMRDADAAHAVVVRGRIGEAPFSVFTLRVRAGSSTGVVIGAVAVDDSNAVRAARRMIDRATVVDIEKLADPRTDLRKLLRG
jgi:3-phenylpropionate/trans-cinnamate dioxygenase ferredoxin reductase subunit